MHITLTLKTLKHFNGVLTRWTLQVKVLKSIRKLEPKDVILGQYKASSENQVNVSLNRLTPTYFAAAFYIDNARWDGVPFLVKTGLGLTKHQ